MHEGGFDHIHDDQTSYGEDWSMKWRPQHKDDCASRRPEPVETGPGSAIKWMLGIAGLAIVGIVLAHVNIQDNPTSRHEAHTFQTVMIVALVASVVLTVIFGIWDSALRAPGPGPCNCGVWKGGGKYRPG